MSKRIAGSLIAFAIFASAADGARQQPIGLATLRGYLDKMGLRYVPHPKNANALVVPRAGNRNAERLDLYVESRQDGSVVLIGYESFRVAVTELLRIADEYTPLLDQHMRKE
jgi:hypothetical protein